MLETTYTILENIPVAAIVAITVGLIRSIAGWLENSYKDGKIDEFEVKELFGTMVKYFSGVLILMLGLPVDQAVVAMFGLDVGTSAVKSITK